MLEFKIKQSQAPREPVAWLQTRGRWSSEDPELGVGTLWTRTSNSIYYRHWKDGSAGAVKDTEFTPESHTANFIPIYPGDTLDITF